MAKYSNQAALVIQQSPNLLACPFSDATPESARVDSGRDATSSIVNARRYSVAAIGFHRGTAAGQSAQHKYRADGD